MTLIDTSFDVRTDARSKDPDTHSATLARYADFFELFNDFHGYVEFYLLQDLVTDDYQSVKFFMPFENFDPPAVPQDVDTYEEFRRRSIDFIKARNQRISQATITNR
jgi:hypothetical protein